MKYAPHAIGALAVVAIAGAVSGATVGDSPILKRGYHETVPEVPIVRSANSYQRATRRPPDHYPLKTPKGTIEVAELALHGRLRDRGGDMWWDGRGNDARPLDARYDFYETASPERIEHERRLLAFHAEGSEPAASTQDQEPAKPARISRAEAPLALAEPAELDTATPTHRKTPAQGSRGGARIVDVGAILDSRDQL